MRFRRCTFAALAREPSRKEEKICLIYVKDAGSRHEGFEDAMWSLMNSSEFLSKRERPRNLLTSRRFPRRGSKHRSARAESRHRYDAAKRILSEPVPSRARAVPWPLWLVAPQLPAIRFGWLSPPGRSTSAN